jgi:hypothetical protein
VTRWLSERQPVQKLGTALLTKKATRLIRGRLLSEPGAAAAEQASNFDVNLEDIANADPLTQETLLVLSTFPSLETVQFARDVARAARTDIGLGQALENELAGLRAPLSVSDEAFAEAERYLTGQPTKLAENFDDLLGESKRLQAATASAYASGAGSPTVGGRVGSRFSADVTRGHDFSELELRPYKEGFSIQSNQKGWLGERSLREEIAAGGPLPSLVALGVEAKNPELYMSELPKPVRAKIEQLRILSKKQVAKEVLGAAPGERLATNAAGVDETLLERVREKLAAGETRFTDAEHKVLATYRDDFARQILGDLTGLAENTPGMWGPAVRTMYKMTGRSVTSGLPEVGQAVRSQISDLAGEDTAALFDEDRAALAAKLAEEAELRGGMLREADPELAAAARSGRKPKGADPDEFAALRELAKEEARYRTLAHAVSAADAIDHLSGVAIPEWSTAGEAAKSAISDVKKALRTGKPDVLADALNKLASAYDEALPAFRNSEPLARLEAAATQARLAHAEQVSGMLRNLSEAEAAAARGVIDKDLVARFLDDASQFGDTQQLRVKLEAAKTPEDLLGVAAEARKQFVATPGQSFKAAQTGLRDIYSQLVEADIYNPPIYDPPNLFPASELAVGFEPRFRAAETARFRSDPLNYFSDQLAAIEALYAAETKLGLLRRLQVTPDRLVMTARETSGKAAELNRQVLEGNAALRRDLRLESLPEDMDPQEVLQALSKDMVLGMGEREVRDLAQNLAARRGMVAFDRTTATPLQVASPDAVFAPRAFVDALRDVSAPPLRSAPVQAATGAWDTITRVWRDLTLPFRPAWLTGNVVGNLAMLAAYDPTMIPKFIELAVKNPEPVSMAERATMGQGFVDAARALEDQLRYRPAEAYTSGRTISAVSPSRLTQPHQYEPGLGARVRAASDRLSAGLRELNTRVDDAAHRAIYQSLTERGMSPAEAVMEANRVAGDFVNLSRFERDQLRRIVPFWAFNRHMLRLTADLLKERPWLVPLAGYVQSRYGDNPQGRPPYLDSAVTLPGLGMVTTNWNPFETVPESVPGVGSFFGLNPIIQGVGASFGVNLSRGREVRAAPTESNKGVLTGLKVFAHQFPQVRVYSQLRNPGVALYDTGMPRVSGGRLVPSVYETDPASVALNYMLGISKLDEDAVVRQMVENARRSKSDATTRARYQAVVRRGRVR